MTIRSLRGFRDYYPEDQAKINYLESKIAAVCKLFGYEEFEGPALESFELYAAKSSDEIINEQSFVFEDRGGEKIVLRPELTPSLARMIAAKQGQLITPARWWSWGRFWRYERPQKGRGREFYQWNLDLIGDNSVDADLEIILVLIRFLISLGLTSKDIVFEISDRQLLNSLLVKNNLRPDQSVAVFKFLDRLPKLEATEVGDFAQSLGLSAQKDWLIDLVNSDSQLWRKSERLTQIMSQLKLYNLEDWVQVNLGLVRGFTYYTGIVFELSDRAKEFRAILGGGRYSNLVADVGGQPLEGIGMGMGDIVMTLFLEKKGLLPKYVSITQACIIGIGQNTKAYCQIIANILRDQDIPTVVYATSDNPSRGLRFANQKNIPFVIILGENELNDQTVTIKNLATGDQLTIPKQNAANLFKT